MLRLSLVTIERLAESGDDDAIAAVREWRTLAHLADEDAVGDRKVMAWRTSNDKITVALIPESRVR